MIFRYYTLTIGFAFATAIYAQGPLCNANGGCGPDNNLKIDTSSIYIFTVPQSTKGKVTFQVNAECEQAVVFYDSTYHRIGRIGTHESDSSGANFQTDGLNPGTYLVAGFMKFRTWRFNFFKVSENDSDHLKIGYDDYGCHDQAADRDYDDIVLTITFEKDVSETEEHKKE